ncbi:sugar ABC transporter ATP-binding protein [Neobacillus jeddahensis]|uniref:sugar ABC transporter ATP-binding protein n=1 Tax=Neobacillus jeddahensis TaxID=1461580 RepID=UPI0005906A0D|nr:sugar ABC transporter ATP-binding protein [Neobacillus jeddahensis]
MEKNLILQMKGVTKSFGSVTALSEVQLDLKQGEVLALMGENGAGKSTLMNILNGAITVDEGEIFLQGEKLEMNSPLEARKRGIAKIHQELQLVPELSIAENIFLAREPRNKLGFVNFRKMFLQAEEYLEALELQVNPRQPVKNLRVGEQQLVEIAKALSVDAKIIIMDEPTSALSNAEAEKLFTVIRKLKKSGVSIIYISHRMDEIFALADRITILRDGQFIDTVKTTETNLEQLITMMVGRTLTELYPLRQTLIGEEILRVKNLSFSPIDRNKKGLEDITLSLKKGEVLGIAGLMGSGRTELFECLFGMHPRLSKGEILIEEKSVKIKSPEEAIRNGLAFVTEDRKGQGLVPTRSIGENISLPKLKDFSRLMFMSKNKEKNAWKTQMNNLKIKAPSFDSLVSKLSGGNQQKVVIGRWLLTSPKILLLDEPTRGIDVGAKAEIYHLINELASQGMGIIMISSELPEVMGMSDRILTFCEGKQTGEFLREEATQEKLLLSATYKGGREENVS